MALLAGIATANAVHSSCGSLYCSATVTEQLEIYRCFALELSDSSLTGAKTTLEHMRRISYQKWSP